MDLCVLCIGNRMGASKINHACFHEDPLRLLVDNVEGKVNEFRQSLVEDIIVVLF